MAGVLNTGIGLLASVSFIVAGSEVVIGMSSLTDVQMFIGSGT